MYVSEATKEKEAAAAKFRCAPVKFMMVTLSQENTEYHSAPSRTTYFIERNKPFEVTDIRDVEFFKGPSQRGRFQQVGIIEEAKLAADKLKAPKEKIYTEKELSGIAFTKLKEYGAELAEKIKAKTGEEIPREQFTDKSKEMLVKELLVLQDKLYK